MKRILRYGLVAAAAVAFATPASAEVPAYCDDTFRPDCQQCVYYGEYQKCVNIGPPSGS